MALKDNQILLTRSEDGHTLTVQIGNQMPVKYSSCPNKPVDCVENAVKAYIKQFDLENTPEWKKHGCGYEGDAGGCTACN